MKRMKAAAMSLVLATAFSMAQDPDEPTQAEEKAPKIPQALAVLGYSDWGLSGNGNKLRQYATPAQGYFLEELYWTPEFLGGKFWLRGMAPGQKDHTFDGKAILFNGKLTIEAGGSRTTFFDTSPSVLADSERRTEDVAVRLDVTPEVALVGNYRKEKRDQNFEAPRDARHDLNYLWDGAIHANLAGGMAILGFAERKYYDRTDVRPDTRVRQWRASYDRQLSPSLGVEGVYAKSKIKQDGQSEASIENWAFGGSWAVGDRTEVGLRATHEKSDLPQVQNAWVRERNDVSGSLYQSFGKWRFQGAYTHREYERIRGDQMYVDVPRWDIYEGKLTGRVNDWLRLTFRGRQQSLRKGGTMQTEDSRALYFDDKTMLQVKLDGGNERLSGYGVYTYGFLENEPRDVKIRNHNFTLGGSYQACDEVGFFGEFAYETSSVQSEIVDPFELKTFFPKSKTLSFGMNWAAREDTFLSATFTEFVTDNDNPLNLSDGNVHGRTFTASLRHRDPRGNEYTFTIAPWRYEDKLLKQMGYRTTFVQITAGIRY